MWHRKAENNPAGSYLTWSVDNTREEPRPAGNGSTCQGKDCRLISRCVRSSLDGWFGILEGVADWPDRVSTLHYPGQCRGAFRWAQPLWRVSPVSCLVSFRQTGAVLEAYCSRLLAPVVDPAWLLTDNQVHDRCWQ